MKHLTILFALAISGLCQAAQLSGAVRINSDTTGTNTKSSAITVSAQTNLNAGTFTASNSVTTIALNVSGLTTKGGQTSSALVAPTGTGTTNLIVNFTNETVYVETLAFATTWITFTNIPNSSTIEMWTTLRLTGNGSRSIQILNTDLQFATAISTNSLASGETEFIVRWTGAQKTLSQSPDPYLTGVTANIQTQLDAKATYAGVTNIMTWALSDMTTALTTGTNKNYWYAPAAGMTIKSVRLTLATSSSSGTPTVDINEAGSTILSTKLTVDANEWDSATAAAAAVISDSAIAGNAKIDFDIDVAGTAAAGAQVRILFTVP